MAFARPFAYNPGTLIPGTEQVGNLSVGAPTSGFTTNPQYWNGPDEQLGYIIAQSVSGNTQPTPLFGVTASVGFFRTEDFTDESFIDLSETIAQQSFANAANAKTWLNDNGYWTSYGLTTPLTITLEGFYFEGSVGAGYQAIANQVLNDDVSISFTNVLGTITGPPLLISGSVQILSGQTSGYTQTFTDYNYNNLTQESSFTGITFNVTGSTEYGFTSEISGSTFDVTPTPTPTNTETPSITLTGETQTPTPTGTPTGTPESETPTPTPTETEVPTPTPTVTPTGTPESETPTPTPTVTETPTGTPSETPTNTPTPTSTDLSSVTTFTISGCTNLNVLVADLGPSALAPGDVFNFTFTGGTPNGCYRIVEKTVATPTDGATPLLFYVNCAACQETLVTPTPSVTPTFTPTPSVTPTFTPTPSVTPEPVTGYSFNLVALPYNFPSSGNTIMNGPGGATSGSTNPNELTTSARGIYWNSIDTDGIDRTNYFSQFTGQSVTITMTQTGSTAIYSGDSQSLKSWSQSPSTGFVFGTNIQIPPLTAATGNAVLIQSASTNWVTGQTVYISVVNNNPSVTPTATATSVTPTPTCFPGTYETQSTEMINGWNLIYGSSGYTIDPQGFLYQIMSSGTTHPTTADTISVTYTGKTMNGTTFDSSISPSSFPLSELILGWQYALPLVGVGGQIRFIVPASLAYGCDVSGPIPANSPLDFTVNLISIVPQPTPTPTPTPTGT